MSKHHHHHHEGDCGCSINERCGSPKEESWAECFRGNNGTFLIFLVFIILAFSCMGGGGL